ncbi:MAG: glycosyltransferase family 4 protein [Bacteroidota bacterium]
MKLLILYEELAGYFVSCINRFVEKYNAEVLIFRKEVNQIAPFDFSKITGAKLLDRKYFTPQNLLIEINNFNPDAILCGGWMYQPYLDIAKNYQQKIPVILAYDNKWQNTIKQKLLARFSKNFFHQRFSHCWVPGKQQAEFARKIGFEPKNISVGFYCADYDLFNGFYEASITQKKNNFPKRFIFTGRYAKSKGVNDLWNAFVQFKNEIPNSWELWCLGKGDINPILHSDIKHFGFVQPEEMKKIVAETSVFILPSHFEPWGVAVHEFAAAGFPLICSDKVGAVEYFLGHGENGFLFKAGNVSELKECMKKFISMNDEQILKMSEKSIEKASKITLDTWADTLYSIINQPKN